MSPASRDSLWQGRSARAQRLSPAEETYTNITQKCWEIFVNLMRNVTVSELCEWKVISRYGVGGWLERPFGGGIACGFSVLTATRVDHFPTEKRVIDGETF